MKEKRKERKNNVTQEKDNRNQMYNKLPGSMVEEIGLSNLNKVRTFRRILAEYTRQKKNEKKK